jgi:hypothetical protein
MKYTNKPLTDSHPRLNPPEIITSFYFRENIEEYFSSLSETAQSLGLNDLADKLENYKIKKRIKRYARSRLTSAQIMEKTFQRKLNM